MSDWIEWSGGKSPVPKLTTLVDIRFRNGEWHNSADGHGLRWTHQGFDYDIVAYRLVGGTVGPGDTLPAGGTAPLEDPVNAPAHYTAGGIECIDAIEAALTPEEFRGFCKGNAIKYAWRERHKGGDESLAKGVWYLNRLVQQ